MSKDKPSTGSIIINDHPRLHLPCLNIPDALFPIQSSKLGFTMCSTAPALAHLSIVPLDDATLGIYNTGKLKHVVVRPPPPIRPSLYSQPECAWEARYFCGSCSPKTEIPGV
ncbi:hypothetical protein BS17DRAFT_783526 [Gyrodon lividus]|nr:hypothetical protein BS17DRAFT_783526 [Gyrodon lividus]